MFHAGVKPVESIEKQQLLLYAFPRFHSRMMKHLGNIYVATYVTRTL